MPRANGGRKMGAQDDQTRERERAAPDVTTSDSFYRETYHGMSYYRLDTVPRSILPTYHILMTMAFCDGARNETT